MASIKETISEYCDRVAFGVVAVVSIALIVLANTGEDTIEKDRKSIKTYCDKIEDLRNKQFLEETPAPDVAGDVKKRWSNVNYGKGAFRPYVMYTIPAVVRPCKERETEFNIHKPAEIAMLECKRDLTAKKPVILVTFKLGELGNAKVTKIEILRIRLPDQGEKEGEKAFAAVGKAEPPAEAGASVTFTDATVVPGKRYAYKIRTEASFTAGYKPGEGSQPVQESAQLPEEGKNPEFVVPHDTRILFAQGQIDNQGVNPNTAFFNIEWYDYDKDRIEPLRNVEVVEWPKPGEPPKESLIPHTPYFLSFVRPTDKGIVVILKKVKSPERIELAKDVWTPSVIKCPEPVSPEAPKVEEKKEEGEQAAPPPTDEPPKEGEEGKAEEGKADEGKAEEGKAEEGKEATPEEPAEEGSSGADESDKGDTEKGKGEKSGKKPEDSGPFK